ncbi:Hsp20/alpha crystallin family protein [Tenacibaculum sp. UWU-22]|uniref:Hsp20/alpha crystallin family protein n=1 Tax=Tenacibaculum sp. UWU-22 TaxID=3234187 RepID=UPI0034DB3CBA
MSNIVNTSKNGSLAHKNSNDSLSSWANLFGDIFNTDLPSVFTSNFNKGISLPKVNIKETPEAFIVEMAVPGLKKSDFKINLDNKILAIETEIKEETEDKKENYTRREFGYSSFKRTFTLPESVNGDKINANYDNGILHISLPKKEEAKEKPTRTIAVS